jgi:hypothetical protein
MNPSRLLVALLLAGPGLVASTATYAGESSPQSVHKLKLAIEDLIETHGSAYPKGTQYLRQLYRLEYDPKEQHNVIDAHPEVAEKMQQLLVSTR